jgi:hypothetical protein
LRCGFTGFVAVTTISGMLCASVEAVAAGCAMLGAPKRKQHVAANSATIMCCADRRVAYSIMNGV